MLLTLNFPINTPRIFHVETTWKRSFPRRFNVEHMWCAYSERVNFINANFLKKILMFVTQSCIVKMLRDKKMKLKICVAGLTDLIRFWIIWMFNSNIFTQFWRIDQLFYRCDTFGLKLMTLFISLIQTTRYILVLENTKLLAFS